MSEMVERVARAIEAQMTSPSGWQATKEQIDRIGSTEPRQLRTDLARAAIEALRVPTREMCDGGGLELGRYGAEELTAGGWAIEDYRYCVLLDMRCEDPDEAHDAAAAKNAGEVWRGMIDAALAEDDPAKAL